MDDKAMPSKNPQCEEGVYQDEQSVNGDHDEMQAQHAKWRKP